MVVTLRAEFNWIAWDLYHSTIFYSHLNWYNSGVLSLIIVGLLQICIEGRFALNYII